jgi:hypothetical protein
MTKQNIPPHISGLFYKLLGERNSRVADFKMVTLRGSEDILSTSSQLEDLLKQVSAIEVQLETLLQFYPDLDEENTNSDPNSPVQPNDNPIGADSEML